MASTYKIIDKAILSSSQASIEFTGLGSYSTTYTDLLLMISLRSDNGNYFDNLKITFNSNTTGYKYIAVGGNGSAAGSDVFTSDPADKIIGIINGDTATSNSFASGSIYIPNFSSSNYKSLSIETVNETNASSAYMRIASNMWSNTAAITSVKLQPYSGSNFLTGSSAYLYGIKNS